jgi:hypothetical protein
MMMGVVPKEVANDAVSVMPKRPLPVIDGGLKAAATPAGKPDADSTTVPANPWDTFTTIVSIAVPPGTMVTMAGEAETEKSGAPRIVRVVLAKCSSAPLTPVIVIGYVPWSVPAAAVSVRPKEPRPLVAQFVAPKLEVTPAGNPLMQRLTVPANWGDVAEETATV